MFDTKIAMVVRDDLAVWQKLNVAVFLTSGIVAAHRELIGAPYEDAAGNLYHPLIVQPAIVLGADADSGQPKRSYVVSYAQRMAGGAVRGLIPYRGVVRFLTGADHKDHELMDAARAGCCWHNTS